MEGRTKGEGEGEGGGGGREGGGGKRNSETVLFVLVAFL